MGILISVQLHDDLCNILEDADVRRNSPFPCSGSYINWPILKESPPLSPLFFFLEWKLKKRESVLVVMHAFFASWIDYYDLFSFGLSLKVIQKQQYLQNRAALLLNMAGGRGLGYLLEFVLSARTAVRWIEFRFYRFNTQNNLDFKSITCL